MTIPATTPEQRFSAVVATMRGHTAVTAPDDDQQPRRGFGSAGLKVRGKLFAMLVRDSLVVKLPKPRVAALIASGTGQPYDPRRDGRVMREWIALGPTAHQEIWLFLAREARDFVAGNRG